jgi:hypothetical protein
VQLAATLRRGSGLHWNLSATVLQRLSGARASAGTRRWGNAPSDLALARTGGTGSVALRGRARLGTLGTLTLALSADLRTAGTVFLLLTLDGGIQLPGEYLAPVGQRWPLLAGR